MFKTIDKVLRITVGDVIEYIKSPKMKRQSDVYMQMLEGGYVEKNIKSLYEDGGAVIDYIYDQIKISVDGELGKKYKKDWIIIRAYNENGKLLFEAEGDGTKYIQPYLMTKVSDDVLWYIDKMFREDIGGVK